MKVTALISDELIEEVKRLTEGKNITESITIALREWVENQKHNRDDLSQFVGIWKDRDISKESIRKEAWK
ncbi:MAG: type II toxin-antitoxin system VapB family antitoxin [Gammaproteobacteria bacterium]|jgi:hypothetical protein|nr:type II toxin-antitoxin system VapB family antitoxin [Xanthomonadales bacterium]